MLTALFVTSLVVNGAILGGLIWHSVKDAREKRRAEFVRRATGADWRELAERRDAGW